METTKQIQQAIERFEPAWRPEERELRGLVVVIDPARSGSASERRIDELTLMTGEHLYHLVRMAGGVPVLTRSDDQPVPGSDQGLTEALAEQIRCGRGHLLVRIQCPGHTRLGGTIDASGELSARLTSALAQTTTVEAQVIDAFKVPAAALTFVPRGTVFQPVQQGLEARAMDSVNDRLQHRQWATAIYQGIRAFAESNREALHELRTHTRGEPAPEDCRPVPLYPTQTPEQKRRSFARQLVPGGQITPDQAEWFCQLYARTRLSNRTLIYFDPHVRREGDRVLLVGDTTDRQLAEGLLSALRMVGVEAQDAMRLLPDEQTLGQHLFGACKATMARTFAEPIETAWPQTQALYGEPLYLLDRREGHYLAQTSDGYWGWLREEAVEPMTREQFAAYTAAELGILLEDVQHDGKVLRRGTRLPVAHVAGNASGVRFDVLLPTGGTLRLEQKDEYQPIRVIRGEYDAEERVLGALKLLYTPYVYGARSPIGLDCSGMVAYLGELTGLAPARDAAQQALAGRLVATRWHRDGMRPGDFLYFMDESGKIFHTGIALNATHFIHASPPEVQISSLRPGDRLYNRHWDETFFIAKRP